MGAMGRREILLLSLLVCLVLLGRAGYDRLSAEELRPLLEPTAAVIGAFTNSAYLSDPVTGIAFPGLGIVLDRSCAGGHFLLLLTALSLWWMRRTLRADARSIAIVALVFVGSYLLAIASNTMRVCCSLIAIMVDPTGWVAGTDSMHQLIGIAIQLFLLILTHGFIIRFSFPSTLRA
jgi:exosortase K